MVQFLSINFFSWISSIFGGFSKVPVFLCICLIIVGVLILRIVQLKCVIVNVTNKWIYIQFYYEILVRQSLNQHWLNKYNGTMLPKSRKHRDFRHLGKSVVLIWLDPYRGQGQGLVGGRCEWSERNIRFHVFNTMTDTWQKWSLTFVLKLRSNVHSCSLIFSQDVFWRLLVC